MQHNLHLLLDPNQHQAMLEVSSNDAAPGIVLRPAMVAAAKKPD